MNAIVKNVCFIGFPWRSGPKGPRLRQSMVVVEGGPQGPRWVGRITVVEGGPKGPRVDIPIVEADLQVRSVRS